MLDTPRLVLRPWRGDDFVPFRALNADIKVMEYFPAPLSAAQSDALAERLNSEITRRGYGFWAVEVKGGAPFIGFVGLSVPGFTAPFTPCVEIGWRLARDHWHQGYAQEAARASLQYGFTELALGEILAFTTVKNKRSRRLMERLGMVHNKAEDFDHPLLAPDHKLRQHVLYRLTRAAWENTSAKA